MGIKFIIQTCCIPFISLLLAVIVFKLMKNYVDIYGRPVDGQHESVDIYGRPEDGQHEKICAIGTRKLNNYLVQKTK